MIHRLRRLGIRIDALISWCVSCVFVDRVLPFRAMTQRRKAIHEITRNKPELTKKKRAATKLPVRLLSR